EDLARVLGGVRPDSQGARAVRRGQGQEGAHRAGRGGHGDGEGGALARAERVARPGRVALPVAGERAAQGRPRGGRGRQGLREQRAAGLPSRRQPRLLPQRGGLAGPGRGPHLDPSQGAGGPAAGPHARAAAERGHPGPDPHPRAVHRAGHPRVVVAAMKASPFWRTYVALGLAAGLGAYIYFVERKRPEKTEEKPKEKVLTLDRAKVTAI